MLDTKCLRCGCKAELLLNLVCCSSPRCNNFDLLFYKRSLNENTRKFKRPNDACSYLGSYISKATSSYFELYAYGSDTFAVGGPKEEEVFVGSPEGEPYGVYHQFWLGPDDVPVAAKDALKEAAARAKILLAQGTK